MRDRLKEIIKEIESGERSFIELKSDNDIEQFEKLKQSCGFKDCSHFFNDERFYISLDGVKLICRYISGMGEAHQVHIYNKVNENDFIITEEVLRDIGLTEEEIKKRELNKQFPMIWEKDLENKI